MSSGDSAVHYDPTRQIRISLDLGSDTTVAYVALPGEREHKQIDLQFFLRALAAEPDLLRSPDGAPSHRLKSRYAVNEQFQVDATPHRREHPVYGYMEVLPEDHPALQLIDFDKYILEQRKAGNLTDTEVGAGRCFYKFIEDVHTPFPAGSLIPNAKLVFQAGVGLDREYQVREPDGVSFLKVHPVELIKNQVCLILQNFVRPHPLLRDAFGKMPAWEDCVVVLTVPNTYSPFHQEVLAKAVSETLGCHVSTITESDAIVFYYLAAEKPNEGLNPEELMTLEQKYLTIDVGKGTTDLTLMSIAYKDASQEEKRARGQSEEKPLMLRHVNVAARTGRASGGGKMTFLIARFFEKLIDFNIKQALAELPGAPEEELRMLRTVRRSPVRLTTKSSELHIAEEDSTRSRRLLEFERHCEWYKKELDLTSQGLALPDYHGKEAPHELAIYIVDTLARYIEVEHGIVMDDEQKRHVSRAVMEALEEPNMQRQRSATRAILQSMNTPAAAGSRSRNAAPPPPAETVAPIWSELEQDVRDYVRENVDEVLVELANAHAAGNEGLLVEDAAEALNFMLGAPSTHKGSPRRRPYRIRTHVIVAGQGSQFKPLRRRLNEVIKRADLGAIEEQEDDESQAVQRQNSGRKKLLGKLLDFMTDGGGGVAASPHDHRACQLKGPNLKDGCAMGALDWYSGDPVTENAEHVHGQLVVSLMGGGHEHWVDMDRLNGEGRYELLPEQLQLFDAWNIFYLPCKGLKPERLKNRRRAIMGTLMACNHIVIEVQTPDREASPLVVTAQADGRVKQKIKLRDALYGAEAAKDLREMLWPATLLSE